MGKHRGQTRAPRQLIELAHELIRPRAERQLQQKVTACAEAQLRQLPAIGKVGHPRDLRAQHQPGKGFPLPFRQREDCVRERPRRFFPTGEKMSGLFAVPVKMRREDDGVNALRRLHTEEGQARFHVPRPVVHAGENVGMDVDHIRMDHPQSARRPALWGGCCSRTHIHNARSRTCCTYDTDIYTCRSRSACHRR